METATSVISNSMGFLAIGGYALAIFFATVATIIGNSLKHRNKQVEELEAKLAATETLAEDRAESLKQAAKEAASKDGDMKELSAKLADAELALENSRLISLEFMNISTKLKEQLKGAYKREGKRFVKIG